MQNFLGMHKPVPGADGVLEFKTFVRYDVGMPLVDITDIGTTLLCGAAYSD